MTARAVVAALAWILLPSSLAAQGTPPPDTVVTRPLPDAGGRPDSTGSDGWGFGLQGEAWGLGPPHLLAAGLRLTHGGGPTGAGVELGLSVWLRGLVEGFFASNLDLGFMPAPPGTGPERAFVRPVVGPSVGVLAGDGRAVVLPGANLGLLAFAPLSGSSWLRLDARLRGFTSLEGGAIALYSLGVGLVTF